MKWIIKFKCLNCGHIMTEEMGVNNWMMQATFDTPVRTIYDKMTLSVHRCNEDTIGVLQLIGWDIYKENERTSKSL